MADTSDRWLTINPVTVISTINYTNSGFMDVVKILNIKACQATDATRRDSALQRATYYLQSKRPSSLDEKLKRLLQR